MDHYGYPWIRSPHSSTCTTQQYTEAFHINKLDSPKPEDGSEYFNFAIITATKLLDAKPLKTVIKSSFSRLIIDEYQDCTVLQHKMILALSKILPTHILGDPLQGIFEFRNNPIVDMDSDDEMQGLNQNIQDQQKLAKDFGERLIEVKILYDALQMERNLLLAKNKMITTKSTFAFQSWVPADLVEGISQKLISQWNCYVYAVDAQEDENFPVLLKNPPIGQSVEMITEMYSLPDCREADPNRIMAFFYIMFFGLMLGDAGYGLLLAAFCGFVVWKYELEAGTKQFLRMLMYCGIATIFWGAMFGGWFGDLLSRTLGGSEVNVAVWFNPINDPERLLLWSLIFGVIHTFTGIGIGGYNLIREKKYLDAIIETLFKYILFTGLIMVVLPFVPSVGGAFAQRAAYYGKYVFLVGLILTILGGINGAKNIIAGLFSGVAKLYDVVSFFSDILSYARILALGLATGVVGAIVNQMAVMGGLSIGGVILFIAVFLFGHTLNIALNALSAYVHSSRLQYIEFFGKFYKGGGKAFDPLKMDTEYIKVKLEV